MQHLFECWNKIKDPLQNKCLFCFLDFDGTLAPIAETPRRAHLSAENKNLLEQLHHAPQCQLAVVSGRALDDVKAKVGIRNLIYAGNHGYEIEGPKIHFPGFNKAKIRKTLDKVKSQFEKDLTGIKGAIVEDKGWTLSVHYRLVKEEDIGAFNVIFSHVCKPYLKAKEIKIQTGKKVFEIRPPLEWNKGTAAEWLLKKQRARNGELLSVYIGDDQSDEEAFLALKKDALTVRVGVGVSEAKYFLEDTLEVTQFLKKIIELRPPK